MACESCDCARAWSREQIIESRNSDDAAMACEGERFSRRSSGIAIIIRILLFLGASERNSFVIIEAHEEKSLRRIRHLRRESPVTIDGDRRRTGEEFVDGVLNLARGLSELGIRRGDVIAIAAFNSDWYLECLLAITYIGGIAAPLNYRWSFHEAKSAMEVVRPVMLVVDENCSSWALELQNTGLLPSLKLYAFMGDSISSNLGCNVLTLNSIGRPLQSSTMHDPVLAPKGVALICFTSGTTGRPKGVALSHIALLVQSLGKIAVVGYGEDDMYLHTAPLCHVGGISSCIAMLMASGCHVFIPKFDAKSSFQVIKQHQVTSLITVPAMMADLISFAREANNMTGGETVNKILNGGGSLSNVLISGATRIFPNSKIISAYGMTEGCSSLTFMTLHDPTPQKSRKLHSSNHNVNSGLICHQQGGVLVGKPASHVELWIDNDCNNPGSPMIGSILTRGLHVMVGYWEQGESFMLDSVQHGWLDTGDVGWLDGNGNLWLVGRSKDRIKSGGENVYPEEVEAVLSQHPGVISAVVIGIPDIRLTEKVVACITMRQDWKWIEQKLSNSLGAKELSSEALHSHCRQRNLTRFKIPKIFIPWRKQLPLTSTGKLKREDMRKEAMSYLQLLPSSL